MFRQIMTILFGTLMFGLFVVVMWRGSGASPSHVANAMVGEPTQAPKRVRNVSNSTIIPASHKGDDPNADFLSTCVCPTSAKQVMRGEVDGVSVIGQSTHEGNSPYLFRDCQHDAADMINLLQEEFYFKVGQSMTRADLGDYPPKAMYFTWDQMTQECRFYLECGGMKQCSSSTLATGVVFPTSALIKPPEEHMSGIS